LECARLAAAFASRELAPGGLPWCNQSWGVLQAFFWRIEELIPEPASKLAERKRRQAARTPKLAPLYL